MKFLLDECAGSVRLRRMLVGLGHDVRAASEIAPGAGDEDLLALAYNEQRVLVTDDKDFGELVYRRGLPHFCIIRFFRTSEAERVAAMHKLIERHSSALEQAAIVVVRRHLIRIRLPEPESRSDD